MTEASEEAKREKMRLKTSQKRKQIIGRCALCDKQIWNNERWVVLHGAYICQNEEFTGRTFELEDRLLREGKIRLKFQNPSSRPMSGI